MSLLNRLRQKKAVVERLRAKGHLSPDEEEVLEELGILEQKNEVT